MPVVHSTRKEATAWSPALPRLEHSLAKLRSRPPGRVEFGQFEREIHTLFNEAEREVLSEELERLDIDLPWVEIGEEVHHRVWRGNETSTSAAGPVTVTRTLSRSGKEKAVSPPGAACRYRRRTLDPVGGPPGGVGGEPPDPGRG